MDKLGKNWRANWVWNSAEAHPRNAYALFRKRISLAEPTGQIRLAITADSRYQLFVDGEFFDEGSVPSLPWYQHFDVHHLGSWQPGEHIVACIVYHRGTDELSRAGLLAELEDVDTGERVAGTDETWESCETSAWQRNTYYFRMQKLSPFQECFDARLLPEHWWNDDSLPWGRAHVIRSRSWTFRFEETHPPVPGPWSRLVARRTPPLRRQPVRPEALLACEECLDGPPRTHGDNLALSLSEPGAPLNHARIENAGGLLDGSAACIMSCGLPAGEWADGRYDPCVLLDFRRLVCAHLVLEVEANGGETLECGCAPVLRQGHFYNVLETAFSSSFTLRPGRQRLRTFHWRGFRYLRVRLKRADAPIRLLDLHAETITYPYNVEAGAFQCGSDSLVELDRACLHTLACCSQETWVDGPTRESGQFSGDGAAVTLPLAQACHGETALTAQFLRQTAANAFPSGWLDNVNNAVSSARSPEIAIPDYSLWWTTALWHHVNYCADTDILRELYPSALRILQANEVLPRVQGLVANPPGWLFIDWAPVERRGACAAYNGILLLALDALRRMAELLGDHRIVERCETFDNEVRSGLRVLREAGEQYVPDGMDVDGQVFASYSEHVQALAVLTGLLVGSDRDAVVARLYGEGGLAGVTECQPFFSHFVLRALTRCGRRDLALAEIERRWGKRMMARGATTVWEEWTLYGRWQRDSFDGGHRTPCHVWSAGPAHFFRVGLSGFRILEPGCGRVALDPYQAPFDYRIKLPLPQGALHVAWLGEELTVDGPDNVEIERASSLLGTGL